MPCQWRIKLNTDFVLHGVDQSARADTIVSKHTSLHMRCACLISDRVCKAIAACSLVVHNPGRALRLLPARAVGGACFEHLFGAFRAGWLWHS